MTPTFPQVLTSRIMLHPTKTSAVPVLDPKMKNNGQPSASRCHAGLDMGSKPSSDWPSTRNPHCKSYK